MPGRVRLGDRPVRRMAFGAMRLAGPAIWGPPTDRDHSIRLARRAYADRSSTARVRKLPEPKGWSALGVHGTGALRYVSWPTAARSGCRR
ncbi:hypothetical protein [Streptomyces sp. NPDC058457]|uniref:hypothetical protein n=1 Tax=Streptomyces sp. NPDC058457 TaxID=3346507 RepID=UPI003649EA59